MKLTGNGLKIIAAVTMFLDHMGLLLFPHSLFLRMVGRLAFPIFAYMIAEGCFYTRSRRRYLALILGLATVCQVVYFVFDGSLYMNILFTFSLAIVTIYALDAFKAAPGFRTGLLFLGTLGTVWGLNQAFTIDYGFWGCMVPVFASLPSHTQADSQIRRILCMAAGLALLCYALGGLQIYSLLALPLLTCYSGQRGKWNLKYFFYIFYPAHLVLLQGLQMLLR